MENRMQILISWLHFLLMFEFSYETKGNNNDEEKYGVCARLLKHKRYPHNRLKVSTSSLIPRFERHGAGDVDEEEIDYIRLLRFSSNINSHSGTYFISFRSSRLSLLSCACLLHLHW